MNQKELQKKRAENRRKLTHNSAQHQNCIRLHPQNNKQHEMAKVNKCWELLQQNKKFVTEAEFKDKHGGIRADIFVLDTDTIYEFETTTQNLEERKQKYPDQKTIVIPLNPDTQDIVPEQ